MKWLPRDILRALPILLAIVVGVGIVYAAATSFSVAGNGAVTDVTSNFGCQRVTNNNSRAFFVPANTVGEWNAFLNNAPNKTVNACCAGNYGQSCTSSANACGQTSSGTYDCGGSCSASTPGYSTPHNLYGQSCTSSANACGQTQGGTYQCNNVCSASTPGYSGPHSLYGQSCVSAPNVCGQTNTGTYGCNNVCSASTPTAVLTTYYRDLDSDGYGNPSVTISACSQPGGYVANASDCNDSLASVYPGGPTVCSGGVTYTGCSSSRSCYAGSCESSSLCAVATVYGNTLTSGGNHSGYMCRTEFSVNYSSASLPPNTTYVGGCSIDSATGAASPQSPVWNGSTCSANVYCTGSANGAMCPGFGANTCMDGTYSLRVRMNVR